jgi:hypothetical protein
MNPVSPDDSARSESMLNSIPAAPTSTGSVAYRRSPRGSKQGDIIRAVHNIKYMGRFIAVLRGSLDAMRMTDLWSSSVRRCYNAGPGGTLRMRMLASVLVVVVVSLVAIVPPAYAQTSHAAPQSMLDAAVQDHVATTAADRELVQRMLERPEVQAVAGDIGLDLRRAQSAVSTLEGQQLTDLAAQARQVEKALAGGQSITISAIWIIIGLLVLILLILVLD